MTRARDIANFGDGIDTADIGDGQITAAKLASGAITSAALPAGSVLQVVSDNFTSVFSAAMRNNEVEDFTGVSLSITPSSTSSKILLLASISYSVDSVSYPGLALISFRRGATDLGEYICSFGNVADDTSAIGNLSITELDSPNTTSSVTYQLQGQQQITSGSDTTVYINAIRNGSNLGESRITLLEIAG